MLPPVNDDRDYAAFVRQFEERGHARIPLTPTLARDIEQVYRLGEAFFARSEVDKMRYSMQSFVEGYRELGPEYSQVPERPDLTESFSAWNRNRGRAEVEVDVLDDQGRVRELARMLAGEKVTPAALRHAAEMRARGHKPAGPEAGG